ncbi:MAG TPA: hypothetical protein PLN52_18205 [Opitutaceae bacterium]|nr:hypothetical protein [Opitutaceae bacterium]
MNTQLRHYRRGLLVLIFCFFSGWGYPQSPSSPSEVFAQKSSKAPEDLSQAELLRSYHQLREQLHATQLAVLNSRVESEAAARAQAAALTEKLDSIRQAIETERERQRLENVRLAAERERQEGETQGTQRTFLWVACIFGGLGLVAMLLTPIFQWRAIKRVVERPSLPAESPVALAPALPSVNPAALSEQVVALSNQRLMTVIDRVEQRILELEHTAAHPPASPLKTVPSSAADISPFVNERTRTVPLEPPATTTSPAPVAPVAPPKTPEEDPRITLLLGKGRMLLSENRAREALYCYDEILKIDVDHTEALLKKGSALERLKRDEEALWCYDRVIEANRKVTLAYLYKGGVFNRQGRYDDALQCYEQALQTAEEN